MRCRSPGCARRSSKERRVVLPSRSTSKSFLRARTARHEQYVFSPAAIWDIGLIWDYTAANWNPTRANGYVREIKRACERLATKQSRGRSLDAVKEGYFKHSVGSHFIVFRNVEDIIDVVRILHQRMDIPTQLGPDPAPQ
ncbi:MAG: type II toxin-antitoxin system RelE/ParE family toxin [Rhizobiaceae bacterium]|nr:type II toxin-antitoxin system RelE/ParE family toxin [Rhizobiaceae bacterium]